jgi:hypothetical protein
MIDLPGVILLGEENPWPRYEVGPLETILAIGVISVNFVGLETAFSYIFGNVLGLGIVAAWGRR